MFTATIQCVVVLLGMPLLAATELYNFTCVSTGLKQPAFQTEFIEAKRFRCHLGGIVEFAVRLTGHVFPVKPAT